MVSELQAADAYCRYLAGRHYENFSVASAFLPSELRLHLARIYAFCRTTDDLGDESGREAVERLTRWRGLIDELFDGGTRPVHPVILALASTVERYHLPRQTFLDLIDANLQDQRVTTYENWRELHAYCMLSAAPVGRMVLGVFEVSDPAAVPLSDDVCIGLQLANFAQDVAVDRVKGRTYLLQEELRSADVEAAVRRLCDRAERLLKSGEKLEQMVPGRLRLQLALYRLGGRAILQAIRDLSYRTDVRRPTVSPLTKLKLFSIAVSTVVGPSTRPSTRRRYATAGRNRDVETLRTPET